MVSMYFGEVMECLIDGKFKHCFTSCLCMKQQTSKSWGDLDYQGKVEAFPIGIVFHLLVKNPRLFYHLIVISCGFDINVDYCFSLKKSYFFLANFQIIL